MTAPNGLIPKLAKIMSSLERVPKRGRNDFHKYDYVMEADLADAVRQEMATQGILMFPDVESCEWQVGNEKGGKIATISVRFTITDGTDSITFRVAGCGVDNPGDKAVYKALTGAVKYALMKMFLIPTGDDPEDEKEDHSAATSRTHTPDTRAQTSTRGDVPPVPSQKSQPSGAAPDRDGIISFGKNKGKSITEVTDDDLAWWTKVCEESVAKNDPKWQVMNEKKLAACQAEWKKRNPWRAVWAKCQDLAAKAGIGEAGLIDIVKEATGKRSGAELTEADYPTIKKAFDDIERSIQEAQ
jgi:ERF superfamily